MNLPNSVKFSIMSRSFPTNLRITINGDEVFNKDFDPGEQTVHTHSFDYEYQNKQENNMKFLWRSVGYKEDGEKDFHIGRTTVNDQPLDIHNYEYSPVINQDWWQGLTADERVKYDRVIHGSASTNFGWHGEIDLYFVTVLDQRSKQIYNITHSDPKSLLGQNPQWIFGDKSAASPKSTLYRRT